MTDTLKSICDQCSHLRNPRLDFIPPELTLHRKILYRDLRELVSAAEAENEKSVVILGGSILEAVLYVFIQCQTGYIVELRGAFEFNPDQSLKNYLDIFNRWLSRLLPSVVLPDYLVSYRDLVHINREISSRADICASASREMLRILDALLEGLSELATPE